ncbi:hypothetical protein ABGB19_25000 [Mycobacterium sp. B14F4]|uniref:YveK family protein n=1 Tax=Mycobacterium sp. B14F4 TaxID=3153565 RepID=UPI00325E4829
MIGAGLGLLRMYLKDYPYSATATVYVTPPISSSASDALTADQYAANRTQLYLSFIESPELARAVTERLQVNQPPEELADRVEGKATPLTSLLSITASGSSPSDARELAVAYAEALPSFARSIEGSGGLRGAPSVVTVALPLAEEPGFVQQYGLLITLMVGLGLVGALYSFAYRRRFPNVRSADQLRSELHIALAEKVDPKWSDRELRRLQAELVTEAAHDGCLLVVGAKAQDHAERFSEVFRQSIEESGRTGVDIVDVPALLESSASAAALNRSNCQQALMVTRYNVTSLRDAKEVRDLLAMNNVAVRGAIILRSRSRRRRESTPPAQPTSGDGDSEMPWPTIDVLDAEKRGRPVRAD